jgi:hypothetical protein
MGEHVYFMRLRKDEKQKRVDNLGCRVAVSLFGEAFFGGNAAAMSDHELRSSHYGV